MNVYFCDVCGVRVTDVDLHSGHGMRRRNDVICAACIDLGHGKEWGEHHAQKQAPALVGAAAGGGNGRVPSPPPRPVEIVRDRVQTFDEDEPASPVKPVSVPARAASSASAPADAPPEIDDTAQVPVVNQELSSMAAGFAALTPPQSTKQATDEDDIEELPAPKLDESGPSPVVVSASPFADATAEADVRADTDGDEGEGADAEKSETAVSTVIGDHDRPSAKRPGAARGKTSSSRVSKSAKVGRGKRPKNNQQQVMLISIASMVVICLIGGVYIATHKSGTHTAGGHVFDDVGKDLREAISNSKTANKALGSHDAAKLQAALDDIQKVRQSMMRFEKVAQSQGWNDEQISNAMEQYGASATISLQRALMYELQQIQH